MTIVQAFRMEERVLRERPWANVELRRTSWEPGSFMLVGTDSVGFYADRDRLRQELVLCPADILADDWEVSIAEPEG